MHTDMTVAKTILSQLGGGRFIAMTGCTNFTGNAESLSFKLTRNRSRGTHMRITLEPSDTYKVELLQCGIHSGIKVLETAEDVYCDMLRDVFTRMTGLYTSLGTMGRQTVVEDDQEMERRTR